MRASIRYVPEGIDLDLSRADLGHPDGRKILERHYRQSERRLPFNAGNPAFICLKHGSSSNPGLFLKRIGNEWWAVHYVRSPCSNMRVPAPMSDEHKRQVDYWARAGEDAGYRVDTEVALPTGTRPDAVIYGPIQTGVEVQRYAMTAQAAIKRSARAQASSVLDVWVHQPNPGPEVDQ